MNNRKFLQKDLFIVGIMLLLVLAFFVPRASAQFGPFGPFGPFYNPFAYAPSFLPPSPPLLPIAPYRYANVPLTSTSSLFPAPTLTAVPTATIFGVGVSSLIPSVAVTVPLPANALLTTPLSPLIAFTPLSLIGLTFAPVPVGVTTVPVPVSAIIIPPPLPAPVLAPTTASVVFSLLSNLLI